MAMDPREVAALIQAAIPDAVVEMGRFGDDNDHLTARVTSAAFAGLPRVRQHQMVYAALGPRMGAELHALALTTVTPAA